MNQHLTIRVANIDPLTSAEELEALFEEFGDVASVYLSDEPEPGKRTYTALVSMESESDAEEAYRELKGEWVDGRQLSLRWYSENEAEEADEDAEPEEEEEVDDPEWEEDWEDDSWKNKPSGRRRNREE